MFDKLTKIKEEFYLKSKNSAFYKENKFNEALYRPTNFVDEYYFGLLINITPDIADLQTALRFGYMSIIKKIHQFIPNNSDEIDELSLHKELNSIFEEYKDSIIFNRIRNSFDRLQTGTMSAKLEEDILVFDYANIRNINSELYARWVDNEKPFLNEKRLEHESSVSSFKDFFITEYRNLWDNNSKKPKNKYRASLIYNNCYERMLAELLDITEDIMFKEFSLDEFRRVYSAIQTLGIIKANNYFQDQISKTTNVSPSVLMEYDTFIDYVSSLSDVSKEITTVIIDMLIYEEQFHKDKVTIYQPLFKSGNYIYYSIMLTYFSFPQDKMLYYLNKKKNNEPAITRIANQREKLMIEKIKNFITINSNLQVSENYVFFKEGSTRPSAEYDLVILDKERKSILVCELKWFIKNDGELDLVSIDKKLMDSISVRTGRLKMFIDNKEKIIRDLFNFEVDDNYEIYGCVISENHSGSANVADTLPVFDRFAFYFSLNSVNYNLRDFHNIIKADDYLPIPPYEIFYDTIEYHGQKYRTPFLKYVSK